MQVFPNLTQSLFSEKGARSADKVPEGVKSFVIKTSDGEELETWRMSATQKDKNYPKMAIVFHGNAASVRTTYGYQDALNRVGIPSYSFDYRGIGRSTGWPSEKGLYKDSEAVWGLCN